MNFELKLFGIMRISVNGLMLDNKNSSPGFSFGLLESAHVEWDMQSFRFSFDYEMRLKTRKNVERKKKKTFLIQRHRFMGEVWIRTKSQQALFAKENTCLNCKSQIKNFSHN